MKIILLNVRKICVLLAITIVLTLLWSNQTVFAQETDSDEAETVSFSCADVTEIPTIECEALVAFYNSTDGDNWESSLWSDGFNAPEVNVNGDWLQTNFPCSWDGVVCSDGSVVELNKAGSNLSGELPSEIGNLTNLTTLSLGSRFFFFMYTNRVTGVPAEIGNLTNLKTLDLGGNLLTTVPAEIGNLINLEDLNLSGNPWTSFPTEFGNLSNLRTLDLGGSLLTIVPAEIGNLTSLMTLDLDYNQLATLPIEIGNLINLTELDMSNNQLTTFPSEIGMLTSLTDLKLSGNPLTIVSAEIGTLTNLADLDLSHNQLAMLPAKIGNLTNLTDLDLSDNQLTMLPAEIGNLTNLTDLDLSDNQLTVLPAEIGDLTNLSDLDVRTNSLTSVPVEIWNLQNLTYLELDDNQLAIHDNMWAEKDIPNDIATISFSFHLDSPLNTTFGTSPPLGYDDDGTPIFHYELPTIDGITYDSDGIPIFEYGVPIEPSFLPDEHTFIVTSTNGVTQSISATANRMDWEPVDIDVYVSWDSLYSDEYNAISDFYGVGSSTLFNTDWERELGIYEEDFFGWNLSLIELTPNSYTFDLIETELFGRWEFDETIHCIKRHADLSAPTPFKVDRGTEFILEAGDRLHCGYSTREHLPDGFGTMQFTYESHDNSYLGSAHLAIIGYDKISDAVIFSDTIPFGFETYYTNNPGAFPVGDYEFTPILEEGWGTDRMRCYTGREYALAETVWDSTVEVLEDQLVSCDFWLRPAIIDPSTLPFSKDFGDLPDAYSTTGENAPYHELVPDRSQIMLGSSVTTEPDGKPAMWAWGDDNDNGVDQLGGPHMIGNYPRKFSLSVLGGVPSEGASLGVWIDWDYNNQFDEDEFSAFNVTIGENRIEIPPTDDYHDISNHHRTKSFLVARFRLFSFDHIPGGTLDWTDYEGAAVNGEIEDYVFSYSDHNLPQLTESPRPADAKDFGDLPDSYSTIGEDAPTHQLVPEEEQIMLGNEITDELDGQPDMFALHDDDDGVSPPASLMAGVETTFYVEVSGNIPPDGTPLGVWLDWNSNGQFSEDEFFSFNLRDKHLLISVTPPDDYDAYSLAVRLRLFSPDHLPGGTLDWTDYEGVAVNGEIEDYFFANNYPYGNRGAFHTIYTVYATDSSLIDERIPILTNPDVAGIDIELGKCTPVEVNSSNISLNISAENCMSKTRSSVPMSVSSIFVTANKRMLMLRLVNTSVLVMGLCVLTLSVCWYGRSQ